MSWETERGNFAAALRHRLMAALLPHVQGAMQSPQACSSLGPGMQFFPGTPNFSLHTGQRLAGSPLTPAAAAAAATAAGAMSPASARAGAPVATSFAASPALQVNAFAGVLDQSV